MPFIIAVSLTIRRYSSDLAVGLALLALITPPVFGQKQDVTASSRSHADITGRVLPAPGERVLPESVSVTLSSRERELAITVSVSMSGFFSFEDLYPGFYSIKVESPGYLPTAGNVRVGARTVETVSISLALGKRLTRNKVPPRSGPNTVDAKWLAVPKDAVREMEKADMAGRNGDGEQAIQHLKKALEIYPDLHQAYTNMGIQYLRLGEKEKALTCLNTAIELNPEDSIAHANLGMVYLREKEYELAFKHLQLSFKLSPGEYQTLVLLGEYYQAMGEPLRALAFLEEAQKIEAGSGDLIFQMASICINLGMSERAIQLLRDFVDANPNHDRAAEARKLIKRLLHTIAFK
jgi:tetratricopeptide (TPR) repeat protein